MIGAFASSALGILRILTPSEIKRLTEIANSKKQGLKLRAVKELSAARSDAQGVETQSQGTGGDNVLAFKKDNSQQQPTVEGIEDEHREESSHSALQETVNQKEAKKVVGGHPVPVVTGKASNAKPSLLESAGIQSAAALAEARRIVEDQYRLSQPSTSLFLIEQREKLKKTNFLVESKDGISSYSKQNDYEAINHDHEDIDENSELTQAESFKGVLVNKKQY